MSPPIAVLPEQGRSFDFGGLGAAQNPPAVFRQGLAFESSTSSRSSAFGATYAMWGPWSSGAL